MTALYSEFDPKAAAWLRELIKQGHIADGIVDERDLWDVPADYLAQFTQVHLCAGIGVWSYALRRAGWPDDRPVWTGSFPCQPFSAAGKGLGFADERHLWPAGEHIIRQCRPRVVFGEQVASKDAEPWLDAVQADLEGLGYAFGACAFPSAGVGAPHIRDRTYWVADAASAGRERGRTSEAGNGGEPSRGELERLRDAGGGVVDAVGQRRRLRQSGGEDATDAAVANEAGRLAFADDSERWADAAGGHERHGQDAGWPKGTGDSQGRSRHERLADAARNGRGEERSDARGLNVGDRTEGLTAGLGAGGSNSGPLPTNGLWRDADWLLCRDGKWRPVEPGTFPLAHGAPARVGRLRGYGNAINAEAAVAFIESYLEAKGERTPTGTEEGDPVQA